jgi:putative DNA primase/helicase
VESLCFNILLQFFITARQCHNTLSQMNNKLSVLFSDSQKESNETHRTSSPEDTKKKDVKPVDLTPNFSDLLDPAKIVAEVEKLKEPPKNPTHAEVLTQLIQQLEPLDFEAIANPRKEENFKLTKAHYLILSIEHILDVAKRSRCGLCKNQDFIYLYNGAYWAKIEADAFQMFLGEAAEKLGVTKFSSRLFYFREQLYKQFLSAAYLPTPKSNKDIVLINLLNGTFEVSSKGAKLRPFDRKDFITYQLPFEYNPKAKAPIFERYINRVLPDIESQRVLAEYLGYLFIKHGGRLKLEAALILYGSGANGKSVFFQVVEALVGRENITNYSLQSLTEEKGYYRANISNKLVNYASEINGKLEASMFKAMVSGETVEACLKYGQPFSMTDYAKFIFNCNELPREVEHTPAFFRRWLIIPFNVTIPKEEQDSELHTKIIESELSGVFNWVLDGLNRLLEQKRFSKCDAAMQAVEQYQTESNSVKMFMEDFNYVIGSLATIDIKDLYQQYRNFCIEDGVPPFKKLNFIKQLRGLGFVVDRSTGNRLVIFIGIASK